MTAEGESLELGSRCAVHPSDDATFTCDRCGSFGCADCRFGGEPPPGITRHRVCRSCAKDGLDEPVPWERRKELGLWRALIDTTRLASQQPTRFFRTPAIERGSTGPILYALAVYCLGNLAMLLLLGVLALAAGGIGGLVAQEPIIAGVAGFYGCLLIGISPLAAGQGAAQAMIGLMVAAGCSHGTLVLLKRNGAKFEPTLRAIAYSFAPMIWSWIPGCGAMVAYVWSLVIELKAIRETHRVGTDSAAIAVFGYRVVLLVLLVGVYVAMVAFMVLVPSMMRGGFDLPNALRVLTQQ